MCGRAIHITHWVCKKSVPFLRTDKIGYFRASNSMACPGHAVLGRVIPKTLRTTNLQSITTKCKQRLSLGRSLGRPCPRRHALGILSLAGSVPAPCERRTYTGKHNPSIFMQWGWELSQQWSSGEFRQIKACNQKGQKGSTGRLGQCPWCHHACGRSLDWKYDNRLISTKTWETGVWGFGMNRYRQSVPRACFW